MRLFALAFLICLAQGCSGTDFASGTAKKGGTTDKSNDDDDESDAGDTDDDDDSDSGTDSDSDKSDNGGIDEADSSDSDDDIETGDETTSLPKKCSDTNIFFAPHEGGSCPANFAAYTADDAKSPMIACCALPVKNILLKDPAQARQTCLSDEVATGVSGGSLLCTKINTAKYKLNSPSTSCYVGDGASGSAGAAPCGLPPETLSAMVSKFGSDACIGQPFGALIVGWTGKNCGDVSSAQLLDAVTNQPIVMFAP